MAIGQSLDQEPKPPPTTSFQASGLSSTLPPPPDTAPSPLTPMELAMHS